MTKQQKESLKYFDNHATDWLNKSIGENDVNIIELRNDSVIRTIKEHNPKVTSFLDLGCGTGQLVCSVAEMGINSFGIDFSEQMIKTAIEYAKEKNILNVKFECKSIFDYPYAENSYDVMSGNGLIEYISLEELKNLLDIVSKALKIGGELVLGSRNKLFNLVSFNNFTLDEQKDYSLLIKEAVCINNAKTVNDFITIECAPIETEVKSQMNTGINVSVRYQYTPVQLSRLVSSAGLTVVDIYPVHIHGITPVFKDKHMNVHSNISNYLQGFAYSDDRYSLVPFASTFMLKAKKGK